MAIRIEARAQAPKKTTAIVLSEQRAEAVRRFLTDAGIDAGRVSSVGMGAPDPGAKPGAPLVEVVIVK
jgi:outer membrane protein OmpA-like peptidoglycan-associated protein